MFKTLYNELNERAQLLENESKLINREIELLNPTTISQKMIILYKYLIQFK